MEKNETPKEKENNFEELPQRVIIYMI